MPVSTPRASLGSRWLLVVVLGVLGAVGGQLLVSGITPRYEASAEVLVEPPTGTADEPARTLSGRTYESYGRLIGGQALLKRAVEALGVPLVPIEDVRSGVVGDSTILRVTVEDDSLDQARELAGRLAEEFEAWLESSQEDLDAAQRATALVIDPGSGSSAPVSPTRWPYLLGGLLVGLALGLVVVRWRAATDQGVGSTDDLEEAAGAPVLGAIAYDRAAHDAPLLTSLAPQHPRAEAVRILRTNLQFVDVDRERTVVTVTSSVEAEGKTTTACNLAIALAQSGARVALVEGDLRRPQVADQFGLESTVGLTTVLVGRVDLDEAVQETEVPGLDVLASGARPPNPAEIVQTGAMERLVADLRERYDVVLIDAPPLLPVADAAVLSLLADGALLVVRHGRTGRDQVRAAVDRLDTVGATLFGTVLSMTPRRAAGRYGYGYEYHQKSSRRRRG
jgi:receptor protein-tyrosine kinase